MSAGGAVSATHAKCERGLMHVFLGACSLQSKIAPCGMSLLYLRALTCVGEEHAVGGCGTQTHE